MPKYVPFPRIPLSTSKANAMSLTHFPPSIPFLFLRILIFYVTQFINLESSILLHFPSLSFYPDLQTLSPTYLFHLTYHLHLHSRHNPRLSIPEHLSLNWAPSSNGFSNEWKKSVCHTAIYLFLWPHGLEPARLLCPWDSTDENTWVCCQSLLQGIFLTQGLNPCVPRCRQILYLLSYWGSFLMNTYP